MIKFPIEALLLKVREFITDPRSNHGKRHPLETVLSIAVCSEPTIRRVIQRVDADEFDNQIGQWLLEQKLTAGSDNLNGSGIAIDGKTFMG